MLLKTGPSFRTLGGDDDNTALDSWMIVMVIVTIIVIVILTWTISSEPPQAHLWVVAFLSHFAYLPLIGLSTQRPTYRQLSQTYFSYQP